MSTHNANKNYPAPINPSRFCRNGTVPQGRFIRKVGEAINHTVAYRRRCVGSHFRDIQNLSTASGSTTPWLFYFRSGHGAKNIRAFITYASPDSGTSPEFYMQVTEVGVGTTDSNKIAMPASALSDVPENFGSGACTVAISGDTDYSIAIVESDAKLVSCVIYEIGERPVDTANGGTVNPTLSAGSRILDSTGLNYHQAQSELLDNNRTHFLSWTRDSSSAAPSVTGTTYTNIIDRSSTGNPSSSTPGFTFDCTYLNYVGSTTVPIKVAVRAEATTGSGSVKLIDDSGTDLCIVSSITTAGWYTNTANVTAGDIKYDLQARGTLAGHTIRVDAVCAWVDGG